MRMWQIRSDLWRKPTWLSRCTPLAGRVALEPAHAFFHPVGATATHSQPAWCGTGSATLGLSAFPCGRRRHQAKKFVHVQRMDEAACLRRRRRIAAMLFTSSKSPTLVFSEGRDVEALLMPCSASFCRRRSAQPALWAGFSYLGRALSAHFLDVGRWRAPAGPLKTGPLRC